MTGEAGECKASDARYGQRETAPTHKPDATLVPVQLDRALGDGLNFVRLETPSTAVGVALDDRGEPWKEARASDEGGTRAQYPTHSSRRS